ncbi:hypothetical protein ACFPRL_07430 [Pseudoclavibacter helvolus]
MDGTPSTGAFLVCPVAPRRTHTGAAIRRGASGTSAAPDRTASRTHSIRIQGETCKTTSRSSETSAASRRPRRQQAGSRS